MTRVLHFIYALSGGGAERQLCMLAAAGGHHGVESTVFCADVREEPRLSEAGVKILRWHREGKFDFGLYHAAVDAIASERPDVVHVWLPAVISIPAMLAARRCGIPCIFSYRNRQYFSGPRDVVEYLTALACAGKIVSNNPVAQSSWPYRKLYEWRGGATIPNAVEVPGSLVRGEYEARQGDPCRLMFVGRLTRQKNIMGLLAALSQLNTRRSWTLDVFGVGELEAEARALVQRLGLSERVHFRGYSREIFEHMATSDVLVFPSLYEGMPNVLVEALALGLPVVASRIIANSEIVGASDSVVWVDPGSMDDIARRLDDVLDGRVDLAAKVKNGKALAAQYALDGMVERYAALYAGLAHGA